MKLIFLVAFLSVSCSSLYAMGCSIGGFSTSEMKLANYYHSQAATSFNVSCDRGYSVLFRSQNLLNSSGSSYVANGPYKLRTQLNIRGAGENLWGVQMKQSGGSNQKYIISAQLQEKPSFNVPAGVYRDRIYVNVDF